MKKIIGIGCTIVAVVFYFSLEKTTEPLSKNDDSTERIPNSVPIQSKLSTKKIYPPAFKKFKSLQVNKKQNIPAKSDLLTFQKLDFNQIEKVSTANLYRIFAEMFPDYAMMSRFNLQDEKNLAKLIEELSSRLPNDGILAKARLSPLGIQNAADFNEHLEAHLPRALELRPDDPDLMGVDMYLAVIRNEEGVEANLLNLINSTSSGIEGELYLAGHYYQQGEMLKAYKWFSRASEKDPENPLVMANKDFFSGQSSKLAILKLNGVLYKRRVF